MRHVIPNVMQQKKATYVFMKKQIKLECNTKKTRLKFTETMEIKNSITQRGRNTNPYWWAQNE